MNKTNSINLFTFKIIFILILVTNTMYSQEYNLEEKTVTGIFEVKEKKKSELFSSINKWISINYNSAKHVIQMNDLESGTIIIKGINEITYDNSWKTLYPKNKYIEKYTTTKFDHLIEINVKDNKFRVIYRLINVASKDIGFNQLLFNCVSFTGSNEKSINEYNDVIEVNLKKGLIGKKKRENFKSQTKPTFEKLSKNLLNDIKLTMQSISNSVNSSKKDDW